MKNNNTKKSVSAPFKFTVDVKRWRCGGESHNRNGVGRTALRNTEGYMCCLGFACRAAGYKGALTDRGMPDSINAHIPGLNTVIGKGCKRRVINTPFSVTAAKINDAKTTLKHKIAMLKRVGAKHNIQIDFVNVPE